MRRTSSAYSSNVTEIESPIVVEAALQGKDPYSYLAEKDIVDNSATARTVEPIRVHVPSVASVVVFSGKDVHLWTPEEPSQDTSFQFGSLRESTRAMDIALLIAIAPRVIVASFSKRLAARLSVLAQEPEEPDELPMSAESLRRFLNFLIEWLKETPELKYPEVALSFHGNIGLEWRGPQGELFGIEFLPDGDVRFVMFVRNPCHTDRFERLSGITSVERLRQIANQVGALTWCGNG